MSDKRKSNPCRLCEQVIHIGPCPHNRGLAEEIAGFRVAELFTHDECQARYEALLAQTLKLEAALEMFEKEFWHSENCIEWPSGATRYGECTCGYSAILRTLAEFKKWRGEE